MCREYEHSALNMAFTSHTLLPRLMGLYGMGSEKLEEPEAMDEYIGKFFSRHKEIAHMNS